MTKHTGTVVCLLADQDAPDDFFEKMLKENPSVAGFAVADNDTIKLDGSSDGDVTLEDIKGICEEWKGSTRLFFFGNFPKKFHENSCQPFVISENGAGEPRVVAFLDGNFEEKALDGSENSAEYDVAEKYLKPALKRIYRGVGGDVSEFMQEMTTDPSMPDLVKTWYTGRASILILAANGEMATFGENALRAEYDWGWVSNPCGYGKKSTVQKVTDAVRGGFKGGTASKVTPPAASSNARSSKEESVLEAEKYHAPPIAWTKGQKSDWYLENNDGVIPPAYKTCPPILKKEFRPIKSLKDLGTATAANRRPIADVVPARQVTDEVLPVMPPAQLKKMENFIKGRINNEGRNILDPKRIAEMEEAYVPFSEANGMKGLEETFHWDYPAKVKLGKEVGIEALALLADQYHLAYMKSLTDEEPIVQPKVPTEPEPEEEVEAPKRFSGTRKL